MIYVTVGKNMSIQKQNVAMLQWSKAVLSILQDRVGTTTVDRQDAGDMPTSSRISVTSDDSNILQTADGVDRTSAKRGKTDRLNKC